MGFVENRSSDGRYRARYRDPLGQQRSRSFSRKADALRVLVVAVEKKKIMANPCDRVHPQRVPKREMVFLSWEQAIELAEAHSERYRPRIYLVVDAGMRWMPGRTLGLPDTRLGRRLRQRRVSIIKAASNRGPAMCGSSGASPGARTRGRPTLTFSLIWTKQSTLTRSLASSAN